MFGMNPQTQSPYRQPNPYMANPTSPYQMTYPPQQQPQQGPQIITVSVSSVDEMKAFIIEPFSTNYYLFPVLSGGKIYLRRMNNGKGEIY